MTAPYYADDLVTLYHGDCLEVTEWLAADVLVTDPPYGIGWDRPAVFTDARGSGVQPGIANDDSTEIRDRVLELWAPRPALVFGSLRAEYPHGWRRMLAFEKAATGAGVIGVRLPWLNSWEPIFVLGDWPQQVPTRSAVVRTRWKSASGYRGYATETGHPHTKPLDVMEALIEACPPGPVADPFTGSGSTLIAARNLGRRAVGVELEERYCEVAARRLSQGVLDFGDTA